MDGCEENRDLTVTKDADLEPIHENKYARRMLVHRLNLEGLNANQISKRTGLAYATVYRDLQAIGQAVEEFSENVDENMRQGLVLQLLDSSTVIRKTIADLDVMISFYLDALVKPDGKVDKEIHRMLLECKEMKAKYTHLHEQSAGKIVAPPTLVQNNNNTNVIMDAGNPELAALRAQYEEAKKAQATMQQMGQAEAEGHREKEEGVLDVEAVKPSHPDVLP